jgi:hypothetical protein
VTASSQTPPGALPPESPYVPRPLPDPVPLQAAVASYAVAMPVPAGSPAPVNSDVPAHLVVAVLEPSVPECLGCGDREGPWYPDPSGRRYPSGTPVAFCGTCVPDASPVQAATGVITAAMEHGASTPREIAQAEQDVGILFDPKRAKDIADAAREQARAEAAADLAQLREENESLAHFKAQLDGIRRLLAGRPDSDLMMVREVIAAADPKTVMGAPLALTWDGIVMGPSGDTEKENTLVPCTTSHGAPAALVLNDETRLKLGRLLGLQARDITVPCPAQGCGQDHDWDPSNPFLVGWSRLEVAALGDGPRWYCSDMCVFDALARASHDLAADDQAAAVDPGQQAPSAPAPDTGTGTGTDDWPPNGGHDALCAYAGGIGPNCTCVEDDNAAGGAL